ncbi:OLC1v1035879C1 [Oldenlandia corymbosa var. corymbosa]|uniref:OLC1v1035879C1 n=1 Tax=Oldenlandia corymbosa var. corymbosa TaxID=529605 RepID=A0AAV1CVF2_OLDCO|nr:OLC1v1035879C1 [Oldenlandia corymbosa var. corymbosa]
MASSPELIESVLGDRDVLFFGVSGDDLCLIGPTDPQLLVLGVFVMELDYSKWNFKYNLDLSPLTNLYPSMVDIEETDDGDLLFTFSVFSCVANKKNSKPELLISIPSKIISCDLQEMIVKEIAEVDAEETYDDSYWWSLSRFRWWQAFEHVETFASV